MFEDQSFSDRFEDDLKELGLYEPVRCFSFIERKGWEPPYQPNWIHGTSPVYY